jgi:hypothetical protein
MGQLGKSNLNLNLNLNLGVGGGSGAGGSRGLRFNGQEFRKLINRAEFPFRPGSGAEIGALGRGDGERIRFRHFWDANLKSYVYLNEFVAANQNWMPELIGKLKDTHEKLHRTIDAELVAVVDAAPDRETRYAEIVHQDGAEGALSYWFGMLMIDPGNAPATCLLVNVARRVGELVVMCLKNHYRFPRPSQLCPAIVPMIDPPVTPSFPAGHALQSYLVSFCLQGGLLEDRVDADGKPVEAETVPQSWLLLDELAERVAHNRIIAGLHYPLDNEGGKIAAKACYAKLKALPLFTALEGDAKKDVRHKKEEALASAREEGKKQP